jgi:hypothetical protein
MATSKPPYDPVKTVEAMFMGSVARIAYVMKDPVNYAPATKAVLAETAKKFQDALDDCEIQIFDAKWYLEHQLNLNRARREAKAREDSAASAKRKRDEAHEAQDKAQSAEGENAPKRIKTQEPEEPTQPQQSPQQKSFDQKPAPQPPVADHKPAPVDSPAAKDKPAKDKPAKDKPATTKLSASEHKPNISVTTDAKEPQPSAPPASKAQEKSKPPESLRPPERTMTQTTTDDFPKPTPQDTPADGNEAFNFESMFGEPSADMMDGAGDDLTFDLGSMGYGGDGDANNLGLQDNSLTSLLPGLESYAEQSGDDTGFSMPGTTSNGLPVPASGTGQNDAAQQQQPANVSDFSLPALGPNEFDDFLNSNNINFDESINLDGDGLMNMDGMDNVDMNMDFDSMFGN